VYLNNLSSGSQPVYYWDFGNGTNSSQTSPSVLYSQPGIYTVTLIVNDNLGCSDTLTMPDYFHVQFAEASFSISVTDTNCYPFFPTIVNNSPQEFNPLCEWNFGDGFISYNYNPGHTYNFPGDFWITLNVLTSAGCNDRESVLVHVGGPFASIIVSDSLVCAGDEVFYNLADTLNVNSLNWNFGDGAGSASYSTSHVYDYVPAGNNFFVSLVYCSEPSCCLTAQDTVGVYEVIAGFGILDAVTQIPDTAHCPPALLAFPNTSSGATNWVWDMGNGTLFNGYQPGAQTYDNFTEQPYTVTVSQIIHNDIGCKDTLLREILIWGKPPVSVSNDTLICRGNTLVLTATGGSSIVWRPNEHLTDSISYQITVKPDSSVCYYAQVSDSIGCRNSDSVIVWVQQVPLLSHNNDTIIIIGEYVQLCAVSDQSNITYVWSPGEYINCTDCPCPLARPLEDITYQIAIQDSMKCFTVYGTVFIEVTEAYTLDLPVVFTPNGDGANDRVYVRGWGIKQLMEFSIYNRWGERVYYSDDLYEGWDGTFKGKALDMDTYTYYVKVLAFDNKIRDKKGNITLLR
jgi:gliding motility-associated-like protein